MNTDMNAGVPTQEKFGVFISYSFEIESLARKIKDKLQVLDDNNRLDIFLASELGGRQYRSEIDKRLKSDQILLLPYPHRSMKLDWVCFELGSFRREGKPVCIMNTNLDKPPEQIADWNAFKANTEDLRRFFDMLFDKGEFTNKTKINPKITSDPEYRKRLQEAVAEIETEFAAFRLDETFFTSRIEIASPPALSPTGARLPTKLSFDTALVNGSGETLEIFGVQSGASWDMLKRACDGHTNSAWLAEIEEVPNRAKHKVVVRTLSPFRTKQRRSFIPVISRIENIDSVPSKLNIIFVEITEKTRISPDVVGNYDAMPARWKTLFVLLDMGRRFRWEVIDPVRTNFKHALATAPQDQWAAEARRVANLAQDMQRELRALGIHGEAAFYDSFDPEFRASLKAEMAPYTEAQIALEKAIEDGDRARVVSELGTIAQVNKAFLEHAARQVHRLTTELY
jgi:hypothetical protein